MIGMAGDRKNTASLIVQIGEKYPAEEKGEITSPRAGLVAAAEQILEAIDRRDKDTLSHALNSFVCMATSLKEKDQSEEDEDYSSDYSEESESIFR